MIRPDSEYTGRVKIDLSMELSISLASHEYREIHPEDENDTRQVATLPMSKETDLTAIIASEGKLELFNDSPCVGTTNFSPDGLEFIEFRLNS